MKAKIIQAVWAYNFCPGATWDKEGYVEAVHHWVKYSFRVNKTSHYSIQEISHLEYLAKLDSRP